ncbi:MAG: thiamine pyrophosphate-binding protein [Verrucomicrobiota bacterium JB023]|nr:thiamine pyrophosphate-binding protein [Verrucomicrobiota bacterium JB023]
MSKEIEALLERGVRDFVVCGGARNAPILDCLSRQEDIAVHSHFEERGAGFFALGRTMATGEPCAVVVTSGTAVAELFPAVIEAYYQARPLIIVSADRPARFRGSGAPQAIEQVGIFGQYAAVEIGEWEGAGPLHVNLELEESMSPPECHVTPGTWESGGRPKVDLSGLARWLRGSPIDGLVVMVGGLEVHDREECYYFCRALGAPVVADATSGLREAVDDLALVDADALLRQEPPGKVLRIGEVPVGRFWRDLEELPQVEVFSITRTGFSGLARDSTVIHGDVARVLRGLGEMDEFGDSLDLLPLGRRRANELAELLEAYPESEPAMIRELSMFAAAGDSVFLGNSLPIREWNDFAQRELPVTLVRASRGANGIDGQLSTWLGATLEEGKAWGIFGDLTVLYDLAAPHLLEEVEQEERVIAVMNNDGGRIFERLPRLKTMPERAREWMTTRHGRDFGDWAGMWGLGYLRLTAREDFDELEKLTPGTTVVEIVPDAVQTAEFWARWSQGAS